MGQRINALLYRVGITKFWKVKLYPSNVSNSLIRTYNIYKIMESFLRNINLEIIIYKTRIFKNYIRAYFFVYRYLKKYKIKKWKIKKKRYKLLLLKTPHSNWIYIRSENIRLFKIYKKKKKVFYKKKYILNKKKYILNKKKYILNKKKYILNKKKKLFYKTVLYKKKKLFYKTILYNKKKFNTAKFRYKKASIFYNVDKKLFYIMQLRYIKKGNLSIIFKLLKFKKTIKYFDRLNFLQLNLNKKIHINFVLKWTLTQFLITQYAQYLKKLGYILTLEKAYQFVHIFYYLLSYLKKIFYFMETYIHYIQYTLKKYLDIFWTYSIFLKTAIILLNKFNSLFNKYKYPLKNSCLKKKKLLKIKMNKLKLEKFFFKALGKRILIYVCSIIKYKNPTKRLKIPTSSRLWWKKSLFFFKDFINMLYLSSYFSMSRLLSIFISKNITDKKAHFNFLKKIRTIMKLFFIHKKIKHLEGISIKVCGRFQGILRKRKFKIIMGRTSLQSFEAKIDYDLQKSYTRFGVFSIKVWLIYIDLEKRKQRILKIKK